ncbi:MAG TPA: N-acetylglucosamine/diacetylchitobiose ABC transporter substrate-binding protein [Rugosimonospora sp.]|nr:N-acetylglucosamine/diacetylchitobiose ABC transporter substrate-binding protein [Rugosimonospora sp.]
MSDTPEPTPDRTHLNRRGLLRASAAAGLLGLPAAGLLDACASGGGNSTSSSGGGAKTASNPFGVKDDAPLEVVIFNGGFGDDYAKFDEQLYNKTFPKAKVQHVATQKIQDQYQPRFAAGNPPDVLDNDGANMMAIGQLSAQLADLTDLLAAPSVDMAGKTVKDTFLPGTVDAGTIDGKFVMLPYNYTVFGFYYDSAVWDKNGWKAPTTGQEMLDLFKTIKGTGLAPFAYAGHYPYYMGWPLCDWIAKVGGNDVSIAIDNLEPNAWKDPSVKTTLEFISQIVKGGYLYPGTQGLTHTQSQQALIDGKAALLPCGTWLSNEMKATTPATVQLTIIPVPSLTTSDKMPYGAARAGAAGQYVVPKSAKNVAGGKEFLRIMASKQAADKFSELTNSLTCIQGAGANVQSSSMKSASAMLQQAGNNIINWKFTDWYDDLYKEFQNQIDLLMKGQTTPDQWIAAVQKAADKVAADSNIPKHKRTS